MAHFEITEGRPGQGKSLYTAQLVKKLIARNRKWYEKQIKLYTEDSKNFEKPEKRKVLSNIKFSQEFEELNKDYIDYWLDPEQITNARDVDIIWDEIATHLDSRRYALLSDDLTMFLSQYRKNGVDIYANTQDFSMVDARARLMITKVRTMLKIIGSSDPSPTKPKIKHIWGWIWVRDVLNYTETDIEKKKYSMFPSFLFITKELISMYDTRQKIGKGNPAPFRHVTRKCEHCDDPNHECNFIKNIHI